MRYNWKARQTEKKAIVVAAHEEIENVDSNNPYYYYARIQIPDYVEFRDTATIAYVKISASTKAGTSHRAFRAWMVTPNQQEVKSLQRMTCECKSLISIIWGGRDWFRDD